MRSLICLSGYVLDRDVGNKMLHIGKPITSEYNTVGYKKK